MPKPENLLWLRCPDDRATVNAHLRQVAGKFQAAGWGLATGATAPPAPSGALAVIDDPWIEPLPRLAQRLAELTLRTRDHAPRWRVPRILGLPGVQGWHPRYPPMTLHEYERTTLARRLVAIRTPTATPWSGFAVAAPGESRELLQLGWPPPPPRQAIVRGAHLFRYQDPASHPRHELDAYIPQSTRLLVDVGCGHGLLGTRFLRDDRIVVGIEPDWTLARIAARKLDVVLPMRAEQGLCALRHTADCIVLADVLEHTLDPAAVLRQIARSLAPDGRAVLSLPNSSFAPVLRALAAGRWDATLAGVQARDHFSVLTPASFRDLAAQCGLAVESTAPLTQPLPRRLRLWSWFAARSAGGDPQVLAAAQWICVLRHA